METLTLIGTFLSGVLTLMMAIGLKVLFDIRGELSTVKADTAQHAARLTEHKERLNTHDGLWGALPDRFTVDRHATRNLLAESLGTITVKLDQLEEKIATLDKLVAVMRKHYDLRTSD